MAPPPEKLSVVVLGGGTVGAQVVRLLEEQADHLAGPSRGTTGRDRSGRAACLPRASGNPS